MADFLQSLPDLFRKRYLRTHEAYLKSLADVVAHHYLGWDKDAPNYAQLVAFLNVKKFPIRMKDDPSAEQIQFRNLRNSWYHELALRYPDDFDIRTKFAGWKIVEAYYSIYSAISAVVRCVHPSGSLSHSQMIDVFSHEVLASKRFQHSFLPPANTFVNQQGVVVNHEILDLWDYGRQYHFVNIEKCLKKYRKGFAEMTTMAHYLKNLREWATYEDAYLLFRMYGASVKQNLDYSLQVLVSFYLTQTEVFLIRVFGPEAWKIQYDYFMRQLAENMKLDHPHLKRRRAAYEGFLKQPLFGK